MFGKEPHRRKKWLNDTQLTKNVIISCKLWGNAMKKKKKLLNWCNHTHEQSNNIPFFMLHHAQFAFLLLVAVFLCSSLKDDHFQRHNTPNEKLCMKKRNEKQSKFQFYSNTRDKKFTVSIAQNECYGVCHFFLHLRMQKAWTAFSARLIILKIIIWRIQSFFCYIFDSISYCEWTNEKTKASKRVGAAEREKKVGKREENILRSVYAVAFCNNLRWSFYNIA